MHSRSFHASALFIVQVPAAVIVGGVLIAWWGAGRLVRSRLTDASANSRISTATVERQDEQLWLTFKGEFAGHPGPLSFSPTENHGDLHLGSPETRAGRVWRPIVRGQLPFDHGVVRGVFSGHLGSTPSDFGLDYEEISFAGERLWIVRPASPAEPAHASLIAIHVHGLGSGRSQTLRSVATLSSLGITSLVSTYPTSVDHGTSARKRSDLGATESRGLRGQHQLAMDMGAKQVLFVGWSLGVSGILRYFKDVDPKSVAGAIFISSAVAWKQILVHHLRRAGLPRIVAKCIAWSVDSGRLPWEPKLFGLEETMGLKNLSDMPVLMMHGSADKTVPIEFGHDFLADLGENVQQVTFLDAHHTLEWNANTRKWTHSITQWCREKLR